MGVSAAMVATAVAVPASAGTCAPSTTCPTTVTFTVSAGDGLEITVPDGPVSVGTGAPGTQVSGQIGTVTVSDERAALSATWITSVTATDFTTGGGTPSETVPNTAVRYWSGPATATTGVGTFVPGQLNAASAVFLDQVRTAFSKTTGSGNNSASWNPTVVVDIPASAVAGLYTGTVNHSVA
ncbi:hypothetical protein ACGF0J_04790 [Nonomuraea sp. NPDC047897]|uniref:hypothetical protein n=1 Tax=Nonomuraea sp. NPDC047897 TaxID=3364346 RepID=UPI00372380F7